MSSERSLLCLLLLCAACGQIRALQSTARGGTGQCQPLDANPIPFTFVWAWSSGVDAADLSKALNATRDSWPYGHARLLCGNSECMAAGTKLAANGECITAQRLDVQGLSAGTPAEQWCRHHVLAKVLAGPRYEQHLQVVMQLAALWRYGGVVALPGVALPAGVASGAWVGTDQAGLAVFPEHGLLAVSAGESRSSLAEGLLRAVVGAYPKLTGYDDAYDYDRRHWPLDVKWESIVQQGTSAWTTAEDKQVQVKAAAPQLPVQKQIGILSFYERQKHLLQHGVAAMNLGDEMQQLAGLQFLPHVDRFVERDDMTKSWAESGLETRNLKDSLLLFANAWYDGSAKVWPPPANIDPVLLALHFDADAHSQRKLVSNESISFLKSHGPVGARDVSTQDLLASNGVPAFYSGDLTFTLKPICDRRALAKTGRLTKTLAIDVDPEVLKKVAPADVVQAAALGSHKVVPPSPIFEHQLARYAAAYGLLVEYACETKLLITERLHAAMPSAAMGTPVLLIDDADTLPGGAGSKGEARLRGLEDFVHTATVANGSPEGFDWNNPSQNPRTEERSQMATKMIDIVSGHEPRLADAAMKFGVLPES